MNYLVVAITAEGVTDYRFLIAVIWRTLITEAMLANRDLEIQEQFLVIKNRDNESRAREICNRKSEADLFFVHFDATKGKKHEFERNITQAIRDKSFEICDISNDRIISVWTCKEMEAWALSDPDAIAGALGFDSWPHNKKIEWDKQAPESIDDPKQALDRAVSSLTNGKERNASEYLERIGQDISLECLDFLESYQYFKQQIKDFMGRPPS